MNSIELANEALVGAGFSSFCFATGFSLYFQRPATSSKPAAEIRLDLNCDWRIGTSSRWAALVAGFPVSSVEPSEPVQAACLAALRWSDGSTVRKVRFDSADLEVVFDSGQSLLTACDPGMMGPAWRITVAASGRDWSIASEGGHVEVQVLEDR